MQVLKILHHVLLPTLCFEMRDAQCVLSLQGKKKKKTCKREIHAHAFRFCALETEEQALLSASSTHTLQAKFVAFHAIIIPRGKKWRCTSYENSRFFTSTFWLLQNPHGPLLDFSAREALTLG